MRLAPLLLLALLCSCARYRPPPDEPGVRDTTPLLPDTLQPADTLNPLSDSLPDTAGQLDTTSRR